MHKLQMLLNEVIKQRDALQTARSIYSRQLAPKFNSFNFIATDELGLSQILADLLNPQGSHGQEEDFLRLFLEYCLPTIYEGSHWLPLMENLSSTKVFTEETTRASGTRRRMDIYLECRVGLDTYGICIENKPYASDQPKQLIDYAEELKNRELRHWHIVYLNESSASPDEKSIDTATLDEWILRKKYSSLKFSDLLDWLKACQFECQNNSVTEFLAQLTKFVQKQFMGIEDMHEGNTVLEIMNLNEENIEASLIIHNNVERMKKKFLEKLKSDLQLRMKDIPQNITLRHIKMGKRLEKFIFGRIENIGFICFEFQDSYIKPHLGVKFLVGFKDSELANEHKIKINKVLNDNIKNKQFRASNWWPAMERFEPFAWKSSGIPWQMIKDDTMAIKILDEVIEIYEVLTENGYEVI